MRASTATRKAKMKRAILRGVEYARKRATQRCEDGSVPFVMTPVDAAYDHRLADRDVRLFLLYVDRQGENDFSWASQGSLAGSLGWGTEKPVRAANEQLEACGYITTKTCDSCDLHPASNRVHVTVVAPPRAAMLAGLDATAEEVTAELVALESGDHEGGGDDPWGIPSVTPMSTRVDTSVRGGDDLWVVRGDDRGVVTGDDPWGIHNENQYNENQVNENHTPPLASEKVSPFPPSADYETSPSLGGGSGGNHGDLMVGVRPATPGPSRNINEEMLAEFLNCDDCNPHRFASEGRHHDLMTWAVALDVIHDNGDNGYQYRARDADDWTDLYAMFGGGSLAAGVVAWGALATEVAIAHADYETHHQKGVAS